MEHFFCSLFLFQGVSPSFFFFLIKYSGKEKGHSNTWYNAGYVPCALYHPHCSWCYGGLRMFPKFHRLEPAIPSAERTLVWSHLILSWCCVVLRRVLWLSWKVRLKGKNSLDSLFPVFHMALLSAPQCFSQCYLLCQEDLTRSEWMLVAALCSVY